MNATQMTANTVYRITYDCRDRGCDDSGIIDGFWAGSRDTWGKRAYCTIGPGARVYYLFDDEIVEIDEYEDRLTTQH